MSQGSQPGLMISALGGIYEKSSLYVEPLLRFVAGAMLVPHGCQKLFGMFGGGGLSGTAMFMDKAGYSPGMLWAAVVGCTELFGGILLAVGLLTRPAAAAITIEMIFAIAVTIQRGWIGSNEFRCFGCSSHWFSWRAAEADARSIGSSAASSEAASA